MTENGSRSVADAIPLKPVDMLVLMTLSSEDRHGYGIVTDITERTDGSVKLLPGNLYSVLRRLMASGLIDEADRKPVPGKEDERRRYYMVTDFGRRVLAAEAARLRELVSEVEALDLDGTGFGGAGIASTGKRA